MWPLFETLGSFGRALSGLEVSAYVVGSIVPVGVGSREFYGRVLFYMAVNVIFDNIKRFTTFLLIMIVLYSFVRFLFLIFNWQIYSKYSISELLFPFIYGMRFDVSAIFLINIIFFLMAFIPINLFKSLLYKCLLLFINFLFIFSGFVDIEYYKFVGARLNPSIFLYTSEAGAQGFQYLLNYWDLFLIMLTFFWFTIRVYNKYIDIFINVRAYKYLWLVLAIPIYFLGARGGWQIKVVKPVHAYMRSGDPDLAALTLNSPFTFLKTNVSADLMRTPYFTDTRKAIEVIRQSRSSSEVVGRKDNVVVIILESFATEFWGVMNDYQGFTSFPG